MGQYVSVGGKRFHTQCHSQDIDCAGCRQKLFGEMVKACNSSWHPKCFKCDECHVVLDNFVERKGVPFCHRCASSAPQQTAVRSGTSNRSDVETRNKQNQEVAANVNKGKLFCAECGQVIGVNDAVSHGESVFHTACFACSQCRKPLAGTGFKIVDGSPVCAVCSGGSAAAGGGFCAGCGQKLTGQFLNAMGQKWHKNCFVCTDCNKPFSGGYAEKGGMPYCATCIQKGNKATVQTVTKPGAQRVGFTVDPRTGAKKYTTGNPV